MAMLFHPPFDGQFSRICLFSFSPVQVFCVHACLFTMSIQSQERVFETKYHNVAVSSLRLKEIHLSLPSDCWLSLMVWRCPTFWMGKFGTVVSLPFIFAHLGTMLTVATALCHGPSEQQTELSPPRLQRREKMVRKACLFQL